MGEHVYGELCLHTSSSRPTTNTATVRTEWYHLPSVLRRLYYVEYDKITHILENSVAANYLLLYHDHFAYVVQISCRYDRNETICIKY